MEQKIKKQYGHIAVSPDAKNRFEYLMKFLITRESPKVDHEDLLNIMMDLFEAKYGKRKD